MKSPHTFAALPTPRRRRARQKEAAAIARFQQDGKPDKPVGQWNAMTWTETTEDKLRNKANGAPMAKQQLTTKFT